MRAPSPRVLLPLLPALLLGCGGAGAGNTDWYYHWVCNGDFECLYLHTTETGTIYEGGSQEGPINCNSQRTLDYKWWGPLAFGTCDNSSTYTLPPPAIATISPGAATPGTLVTITGTNFPLVPSQITLSIGGVTLPATTSISTSANTITFMVPNIASVSGPVTVHTPAGQATTSTSFTVLDDLRTVAWSGAEFVAGGNFGTLLRSTDGSTWTAEVSGVATAFEFDVVAWTGTQFAAYDDTAGNIVTSQHGVTWASQATSSPARPLGVIGTAPSLFALGTFSSTHGFATSADGVAWTYAAGYAGSTTGLYALTASPSLTVAVGYGIQTSPDGVTWTQREVPGAPHYAVAYSGSLFATVGAGGLILTSPDGITWTARSSGTTKDLRAVTWFAGKFVAVGQGGIILTSPDGITWTARDAGITTDLNAVAASGTLVVAVGNAGLTISSSDGITWASPAPSAPTNVAATKGSGQSTISWSPVTGATSYYVYASPSNTVSKTSYWTRVAAASSPAVVTGLATGVYYYFVVTAVNAYGEGPASAPISVCAGIYLCY